MTANKTTEILQRQIDKLNQEQTETKWNEKDKKLFEKFLGLVHDDPFRIFYADGGEVHRILELVYPNAVKEEISELFRIKYVYDGFLKYGEVVKPQIEKERPNLETLIKDISDHYLEVYRKQKKVKENAIKQCRIVLEKMNKQRYVTLDDCSLLLGLASNRSIDERVDLLSEILENNNSAIQELLKMKIVRKPKKEETEDELEVTKRLDIPNVIMEADPEEKPKVVKKKVEVEPEIELEPEPEIDPELDFEFEPEEPDLEIEPEEVEESKVEQNTLEETTEEVSVENYTEQYLHALKEIDPTDTLLIQRTLPKPYMPNFNEIMKSLITTLKQYILEVKEEEQNSGAKRVRELREELGKTQQLLKVMVAYLEKNEAGSIENKEKLVEGEAIQLLLLENEEGDSLVENDFKRQLDPSQYKIAMELLYDLEQFSDPEVRSKAKVSPIVGILELSKSGVHVFFEPFAENTYIVIAILAEKNGYRTWVEDKLRLRHGLFQRQEKGMQKRWNQHGTRNTMLLGSETAYLEMQDMAEKR